MHPEHRAPTAEEAQTVFDAFGRIMGQAAAHNEVAKRLAFAATVAHIHVRDAPQDLTMTLMFDRDPIEVVEGAVGDPEIHLWIDTNDLFSFWMGDMHLAMAIAKGRVEYSGPVRKILRIVPIARRLVSDFQTMVAADAAADDRSAAAPAATNPI